ncbi:hypothetical protein ISN45_Aa08g030540 [Arabidopsis thaliana x Arabidopsis arenosa]|uniref:Uncharacterized protein n=1 Tax=Arabidopsis thaliana x Arabidopsis arenosa TaxID=1240361 RepID=A0A8T1XMU4_9BRAS|nr:hypothetical protein ISN45_Aa08g030540 [Arabidopsis thaliana x Arabidopsis arenosa]
MIDKRSILQLRALKQHEHYGRCMYKVIIMCVLD